jgi:hypothetical protein
MKERITLARRTALLERRKRKRSPTWEFFLVGFLTIIPVFASRPKNRFTLSVSLPFSVHLPKRVIKASLPIFEDDITQNFGTARAIDKRPSRRGFWRHFTSESSTDNILTFNSTTETLQNDSFSAIPVCRHCCDRIIKP